MDTVPPAPASPSLLLRFHDAARIVREARWDDARAGAASVPDDTGDWDCALEDAPVVAPLAGLRWVASARRLHAPAGGVSLGLRFEAPHWSGDHYLLMPGAVYAGNRFRVPPGLNAGYPPRLPAADCTPDTPLYVADIPRLNHEPGASRIQMLAGEMAWPAVAWWDPRRRRAFVAATNAQPGGWQTGFDVRENDTRDRLVATISVPGVRERRFSFGGGLITTDAESPDRGADLAAGEALTLAVDTWDFACDSLAAFFEAVFVLMRAEAARHSVASAVPLSEADRQIVAHYHRDYWWPEAGLFSLTPDAAARGTAAIPYSNGWVGGLAAQQAMLVNCFADERTRERCRVHLDRVLTQGMTEFGLFYGKIRADLVWDSEWSHQENDFPWRRHFTLVRRQGDSLTSVLKAFDFLERAEGAGAVPPAWNAAARKCASALCAVRRRHGQWGILLHRDTGEVLVGNSTSGASVVGALARAYRRFGDAEFLAVALAGLDAFDRRDLAAGVTTGGPSDAGMAPEHESCYALIDGAIELWEITGESRFIDIARRAAHQFGTWAVPYNFVFPADTEFGRQGLPTQGALLANAQNKCGVPAICTDSGLASLKLFRATGEVRHLDLLRDITRLVPHYLSREDRPLHAHQRRPLPSGWINERVNMGDWDNNVGGFFYGSNWCEVGLMLAYAELPGVYAQPDTGLVSNLEHVEAAWTQDRRALRLSNPTAYPARVRVLVETSSDATAPIADAWRAARLIDLPSGGDYVFSSLENTPQIP